MICGAQGNVFRELVVHCRTRWSPPGVARMPDAFDRHHSRIPTGIQVISNIRMEIEAISGPTPGTRNSMMEAIVEPVPYEIRESDVDEVLGAHGVSADRDAAFQHIMKHTRDIDEIVRTAPETPGDAASLHRDRGTLDGGRSDEPSHARREFALAAIEDVLIRDGFLDADAGRVFPVAERHDR